eukprot:SAG31_NODE_39003_length_291_cov_1.338542_1_plen_41_part_01
MVQTVQPLRCAFVAGENSPGEFASLESFKSETVATTLTATA